MNTFDRNIVKISQDVRTAYTYLAQWFPASDRRKDTTHYKEPMPVTLLSAHKCLEQAYAQFHFGVSVELYELLKGFGSEVKNIDGLYWLTRISEADDDALHLVTNHIHSTVTDSDIALRMTRELILLNKRGTFTQCQEKERIRRLRSNSH